MADRRLFQINSSEQFLPKVASPRYHEEDRNMIHQLHWSDPVNLGIDNLHRFHQLSDVYQ
jgi:hypothetical protein